MRFFLASENGNELANLAIAELEQQLSPKQISLAKVEKKQIKEKIYKTSAKQ